MLVLTRRFRFLWLTPVVGAAIAYLGAQALGEFEDAGAALFRWGGTCALGVAILGAFRVARLFSSLLAFARRTLFLSPSDQRGKR